METTPPSHKSEPRTRTKSASRLSKIRRYNEEEPEITIPNLSLEIVPSSPVLASPSPASNPSPGPPYSLPLHELLRLSPSPLRRSKTRLAERLEMGDNENVEGSGKRRYKGRSAAVGVVGCASPRIQRRSRRRVEVDIREDNMGDEVVKPRKKRHSGRSKKDKQSIGPPTPSPRTSDVDGCNLDRIGQLINDLVMWRDVAKSSLWFGFGSLCFLSSCFAREINFSFFSMMSQLGLLFLGVSFFSNSLRQRDGSETKREFKLKEDDIVRFGRLILPALNLAISKTRKLFSGEPAMTLKVVPFLLIGAEYGCIITLWRLCALGFFFGFTAPRLYSSYSHQICQKAEYMKSWLVEAWGACSHKKIVAASAVTAFWNLTSIRTRIFAAFICLVIVRYSRQYAEVNAEEEGGKVEEEKQQQAEPEQQQALVAVESGSLK